MESTAPPNVSKHLWLWVVFSLLLLALLGVGGYLLATGKPAFYSPPDVVRKSRDYDEKMNPPKISFAGLNTNKLALSAVSVTTNQGKIRIEYPEVQSSGNSVVVQEFKLHRAEAGELVKIEGVEINLKRIGQAWAMPTTNANRWQRPRVPASFYRPNLVPMKNEEVVAELPDLWERQIGSRDNYNAYRFDFDINGGDWKFLSGSLFDARTHAQLVWGYSSGRRSRGLEWMIEPHIWHETPLDLVLDISVGPLEEEEMAPQQGNSFSVGPVTYQLLYCSGGLSTSTHSSGSSGKMEYMEFVEWTPAITKKKESVFLFKSNNRVDQKNFEITYLDAENKPLNTSAGGHSSQYLFDAVYGDLAEVKKIRVRKYPVAHRIIYRLPGLPLGVPSNQKVDNLFQASVPMLRFDYEYEQKEFIQRVAQVEFGSFPRTNLPAGTYPRYFTNATVADVLKDYEKLMGAQGQAYVNQEKLQIEVGKRPWPLEALGKVQEFLKKIKGP